MNRQLLLSTLLFLLLQTTGFGQTRLVDKIYADVNIGGIILGNSALSQLQAGLGYRINKQHGLGVSY
ncbi:MAG: hypothetical protein AAGA31_14760, partial [Bacteroidota bacterium]